MEAIILFVVVSTIYIGSYYLNKKTPLPECFDPKEIEVCSACAQANCTIKKRMEEQWMHL
ncbi:MAG: hypothetical protein JJV90_01470 [Spiroplasma sp.]|nr:hypothetical protein [Mycoplasmatales bacterium]